MNDNGEKVDDSFEGGNNHPKYIKIFDIVSKYKIINIRVQFKMMKREIVRYRSFHNMSI